MSGLTVFYQMLVLFAMMGLGYVVRKKDVVNGETAGRISALVVNVFNPIMIINSVLAGMGSDAEKFVFSNILMILLHFVILIAFSLVLLKILRPVKQERPMYVLMTCFSNIGYMGIPVAKSVYGDEGAFYIAFYVLGFSIFLYTFGLFVAERVKPSDESERQTQSFLSKLKKFMNPGMLACIIAVIIFAFNISVPAPIESFCEYMGTTTIPLSMLVIGITFADVKIKEMLNDWRAYVFTVLRMVLLPVLASYATRSLPLDDVVYGIFILELSMPVASIVTLLVQERGVDATCCVRSTILTTLASIVTVPLVFALTMG